MFVWTDERVELLTLRWAEGFSARKIADEFGGVTRSAIIGKVHRLKLPGRQTVNYRVKDNRIVPARNPKPRRIRLETGRLSPLVPQAPAVFTAEHFCTIEQLTEHSCRWPCWADDAPPSEKFFCGSPTADIHEHRPYCGFHSRIAFTPPKERKQYHWQDRAA